MSRDFLPVTLWAAHFGVPPAFPGDVMGEAAPVQYADDIDIRISNASLRAFDTMDKWPHALRECVHEFGFPIVDAFVTCGVTEPRHIRHLTLMCWRGARSGTERAGFRGGRVLNHLDAVLLHSGSELTGQGLLRVLREASMTILPVEPMPIMVDASIEETANLGLVSKREKHTARLRAAMRAGAVRLWPQLFGGR